MGAQLTKTERIPVMMSPNDVRDIENVRFERRIKSRSETIRFLVRKGIEAISESDFNNDDGAEIGVRAPSSSETAPR